MKRIISILIVTATFLFSAVARSKTYDSDYSGKNSDGGSVISGKNSFFVGDVSVSSRSSQSTFASRAPLKIFLRKVQADQIRLPFL